MTHTKKRRRARLEYAAGTPKTDLAPIHSLLWWCYALPPADVAGWVERAGRENLRLLTKDGAVLASLFVMPLGQFFGGRSVPMVGVAGVGVAPDARGEGVGHELMRKLLAEMVEREVAVSTLFPSTLRFYRAAGWEIAGMRYGMKVAPADIRVKSREGRVRAAVPADRPAMERVHRNRAAITNGELDRSELAWSRVLAPRGQPARAFVVENDGVVEGYCVATPRGVAGSLLHELFVTDLAAATRRAALRLLAFLADHWTMVTTVSWFGGAASPFAHLLPERRWQLSLVDPWMLRIVRLPAALEARGYPLGLAGELHLDVRDELVRANRGRFVVTIEGGQARVRRGGRGDLALDVRTLAPLFTSHLTAEQLAVAGDLAGPAPALAFATAAFAGPAPGMTDAY